MKSKVLLAVVLLVVGLGVAASQLGEVFTFHLSGHEEVPVTSTVARAELSIRVIDDPGVRNRIEYDLFYDGLEGDITQAHIHVGQRHVNGGISAWLCGTPAAPGPAGTPPCPPSPGVVRGSIQPANVVGPAAQGIAAGEYSELIRMLEAGHTYGNVHSTKFPSGEVRAQISVIQNGEN